MKKHKYIELKENTIRVLTPVPYRTQRKYSHESEEDVKDKVYRLNEACKFLYECMRLLGISRRKAREMDFTLNIATGEKIIDMASRRNISHAMFMTIKNYNW